MRNLASSTVASALALMLLSTPGCSNQSAYTPVEAKTEHSETVLFQATRRALEQRGYEVVRADPESYTAKTKAKEVAISSVPRLSYRYAFTVQTTEGLLRIEVSCEENSALDDEAFEDCGESRPERVLSEMRDLKQTILELAETTEDRGSVWEMSENQPLDSEAEGEEAAEKSEK